MDYRVMLVSFLVGFVTCIPIIKYLFKAVWVTDSEFEKEYEKETGNNMINDFLFSYGFNETTINAYAKAIIVVILLPIIPITFVALPVYFLIQWLF
jgi:hypothetical protein